MVLQHCIICSVTKALTFLIYGLLLNVFPNGYLPLACGRMLRKGVEEGRWSEKFASRLVISCMSYLSFLSWFS